MPRLEELAWEQPGVVVRGPYGHVEKIKERWDGRVLLSNETKVVDVLIGTDIYSRIPVKELKVLK
jgi:hypothetical protein